MGNTLKPLFSLGLFIVGLGVAGVGCSRKDYKAVPLTQNNDARNPSALSSMSGANGYGVSDANPQVDSFTLTPQKKIDILFVVDNSDSMADKQATLTSTFASFISDFATKGHDFHIGIVSTDTATAKTTDVLAASNENNFWDASKPAVNYPTRPRFAYSGFVNPQPHCLLTKSSTEKFLTSSSTNLNSKFSSWATLGTNGSGFEKALYSVQGFLESSRLSGCNQDFLRSDAYLSIVILTDSNEYVTSGNDFGSRNSTDDAARVQSFKSVVQTAKGGSLSLVRLDAFVGMTSPEPGSSFGSQPILNNYSVYKKAVQEIGYGSSYQNIQSGDLSAQLSQLGSNIAGAVGTLYGLSHSPEDPAGIVVKFNGIAVPQDATNGWTYLSGTNQVQLNGAAAVHSESVSMTIQYVVAQ